MYAFDTYIPEILSSFSFTVVLSLSYWEGCMLIHMHLCPEFISQDQFRKGSFSLFSSNMLSHPSPSFSVLYTERLLTIIFTLKPGLRCRVESLLSLMAKPVWSPGISLIPHAVRLHPRMAKAYIHGKYLNPFLSDLILANKECQQSLDITQGHDPKNTFKLSHWT